MQRIVTIGATINVEAGRAARRLRFVPREPAGRLVRQPSGVGR